MIGDRYSTDVLFGNLHGALSTIVCGHSVALALVLNRDVWIWCVVSVHLGLLTIRTDQFTHDGESVVNVQLQRIEKAVMRLLAASGVRPIEHPLVSDARSVTK